MAHYLAKEFSLLRETDRSVIPIANDVGNSTPSHFVQLFREETGLSPSDYRRQW